MFTFNIQYDKLVKEKIIFTNIISFIFSNFTRNMNQIKKNNHIERQMFNKRIRNIIRN